MNKQDLEALVKECISEVVAEGYDEFQRADKGSKGVAAKNKAEEDTYGAGYAAGEKAAKSKYKKLAEAYKQLKEEGFGLGPKGLDTNDNLDEAEAKPKMTTDAQAVINIIEKQPMLVQKLALINSREELEGVFDYLVTKLNPQLAKNPIGVRTAVNNTLQKVAKVDKELDESAGSDKNKLKKYKEYTYTLDGKTVKPEIAFLNNILKAVLNNKIYNIGSPKDGKVELKPESGKKGTYTESADLDEARFEKGEDIGKPGKGFEKIAKAAEKRYGSKEAGQKVAGAILKKVLNEDNLQVKSIAKNIYSVLTKNGVNAKLIASIPGTGYAGKSIGATLTGGSNEALVFYWDDTKTKLTTIEIYLSGDKEDVLNFEKKILSSFPGLEQYSRAEYSTPQAFKLVFRVKEKTTAKGGIQELKKVLKK